MWVIERVVSKGEYLYALVKGHPKCTKNGYVLLHRVIMENHLGRLLLDNEVVHHRDENKKNNDISNLEIMESGEHVRMHNSTGEEVYFFNCGNCGKLCSRKGNQKPSSKGYKMSFCSRSCNGKYYSAERSLKRA